jgi:multidrug efflux pump subunit AcrA (membrane-fusion protein)
MVDPTDLKADLYLPSAQLARIRPGQSVQAVPLSASPEPMAPLPFPGPTARPGPGPGRSLTGRVTYISPVLDAHSGQGRVRILYARAGRHHRPGTLVRVYFGQP